MWAGVPTRRFHRPLSAWVYGGHISYQTEHLTRARSISLSLCLQLNIQVRSKMTKYCAAQRQGCHLPGCSFLRLSLRTLEVNFCQIKPCFLWNTVSHKKHVKSDIDSGVPSCLIECQEPGSYTGILHYKVEFILGCECVCLCVCMYVLTCISHAFPPRESLGYSSTEGRHMLYKAHNSLGA